MASSIQRYLVLEPSWDALRHADSAKMEHCESAEKGRWVHNGKSPAVLVVTRAGEWEFFRKICQKPAQSGGKVAQIALKLAFVGKIGPTFRRR